MILVIVVGLLLLLAGVETAAERRSIMKTWIRTFVGTVVCGLLIITLFFIYDQYMNPRDEWGVLITADYKPRCVEPIIMDYDKNGKAYLIHKEPPCP